jgi:hypothetical protein
MGCIIWIVVIFMLKFYVPACTAWYQKNKFIVLSCLLVWNAFLQQMNGGIYFDCLFLCSHEIIVYFQNVADG